MRAEQANHFAPLPEERMTVPSLGGDGVVLIRSIGFGAKMFLSSLPHEKRAGAFLAFSVMDEAGAPLMPAEAWDVFGMAHEDDFIELSEAAARVSGLRGDEAKKD